VAYQTVQRTFFEYNGVNYDLQYDSTNGNVQLIQQGSPSGTAPIYYDGGFTTSGVGLNIPTSTQNVLHEDIKDKIQAAFTSGGGRANNLVLAQWVQQNNPPGINVPVPAQNPTSGQNTGTGIGGLLNTALRPGSSIQGVAVNNDIWNSANALRLFQPSKTKPTFKYPLDLAVNKQDTMVITAHRYVPVNADLLTQDNFGSILREGLLRGRDSLEEIIGMVTFPMPMGIMEQKSINWGQGEGINPINAAVGSKFANNSMAAMGGALAGGTVGTLLKQVLGIGPGAMGGAKAGAQGQLLMEGLTATSGSTAGQALIGSALVDRITNMLGYGISAETILARGAGVVSNDNMELLFNGPQLRNFQCAFRLTARSREEAKEIRTIIRFFKQVSSPKKISGVAGNRSLFLGTPDVFKIKFLTSGGKEIEGVARFKTCALTSVQTDYTPDRYWVAFDDGQPVSTTLALTFQELEPIYENDYQESILDSRTDLRPVGDTSVGY